jgi:hypothetical protein
LNNETPTGFLGLVPDEMTLPSLPTVQARTAWLLGRATDKAPAAIRPIVRSMLLPKLEALDSTSLLEALTVLQTAVLPWLIGDNTNDAELDVGEDYELAQ